MLTYSHDDECFYVAELSGAQDITRGYQELAEQGPTDHRSGISVYLAQEGNISFKQLSADHQEEFLAARKKEADSLVSAGAVRILNDEESRRFEERKELAHARGRWGYRDGTLDLSFALVYDRGARTDYGKHRVVANAS